MRFRWALFLLGILAVDFGSPVADPGHSKRQTNPGVSVLFGVGALGDSLTAEQQNVGAVPTREALLNNWQNLEESISERSCQCIRATSALDTSTIGELAGREYFDQALTIWSMALPARSRLVT